MPLRAVSSLLFSWQAALVESIGLWGVIAQVDMPASIKGLLNGGALGILGYAVYRLFGVVEAQMKASKADRDAQRAEREAQQAERQAQREEREAHVSVLHTIADRMQSVQEAVQQTRIHCAEVLAGREAGDEKREAGN